MKKAPNKHDFAKEIEPFENKWVALVDDKVVASGDSPKEVKEKAEHEGYKDFVFHLVPSFSHTFAPRA